MADCLLAEDLDGFIIENPAGFVDQAIMAVTIVRIKGDISDHCDVRGFILDCPDGFRDQAILVIALGGVCAFEFFINCREQDDCTDAQRVGFCHFPEQVVRVPALTTRHGINFLIMR